MNFDYRETEKIWVPVFISCDSPWGQMSQVVRSHSVSFLWGFLHCQVLQHFSSHGPGPFILPPHPHASLISPWLLSVAF